MKAMTASLTLTIILFAAGAQADDAALRELTNYRVLHEGVPVDAAKDDLNGVWVPNDTWRELIFEVLEDNGVSPNCDACLWE